MTINTETATSTDFVANDFETGVVDRIFITIRLP